MSARAMKDSGVAWLGEIPAEWQVRPFKRLAVVRAGQVDPRDVRYQQLPLYAPNHIESGTGRLAGVGSAEEQGAESGKYQVVRGDIIYSKIRPALAKVCLAPADGLCSADMYPIWARTGVSVSFLMWSMLAHGFTHATTLESERVAMPKINRETLAEIPLLFPPLREQQQIASFLDERTATIDAAIAEHERNLDLLAERRRTLVSSAVTRGLDPNVPMRDSGVDSIGEIPRPWSLVRLGRVSNAYCDGPFGSSLKSSHYVSDGVRVIRLQNIGAGTFRDGDPAFIAEEHFATLGRHEVRPRDLLVAGLGDENHPVGRACVAPATVGRAMVKADCFRFRLNVNVALPEFVALYLSSDAARSEAATQGRGATRLRINLQDAARLRIPLPSLVEQRRITSFLDENAAPIDAAIEKTRRAVELLREYRQSLITAAVTGRLRPGETH
jgi:type I restriction enzyme S subunit